MGNEKILLNGRNYPKIVERGINMEENKEMTVSQEKTIVQGIEGFKNNSQTKKSIITSVENQKTLFNLDTTCDNLLNNCIGEKIRIVDFVCKIYEKPLKEPIINEETGEIKETEYSMSTILIDEHHKSYVTGSKSFFFQFKKLCEIYTLEEIKQGIDIEIINVPVKNSNNKALGFKLVD